MLEKYYRHHNESIRKILPAGHYSMIMPKAESYCPNEPWEHINEKRVS